MDHSNSAVKLAMELANLCAFNGMQDLDQQSCLSDHFSLGSGQTLAQINDELKAKKSQNMTECVPVPSSEHVAEIVGRQGELIALHHLATAARPSEYRPVGLFCAVLPAAGGI